MIFERLFGVFSHDIAIDLGTANTLVAVKDRGIMVREPTIVVKHKKTKQILAVGNEAKQMWGKTPANMEAIRPLRYGVIADFDATEYLLHTWIKEVHHGHRIIPQIPRPRVIVGIPSGITEVERRAVQEACLAAGARKVWLIEEPMAAAIGAESPVEEPSGILVVDIGGGTTEIAAISLSGMVVKRSIKYAGDEMDQAIIRFIRVRHSLLIGDATAERIKLTIGGAFLDEKTKSKGKSEMVVRGRNLETGLPESVVITQTEIVEALESVVNHIVIAVQDVIEEVPPELTADILERGVVMTGGGALLIGFDRLMAKVTKVPVWVAPDPLTCVVRGCLKLYDNPGLLEKVTLG